MRGSALIGCRFVRAAVAMDALCIGDQYRSFRGRRKWDPWTHGCCWGLAIAGDSSTRAWRSRMLVSWLWRWAGIADICVDEMGALKLGQHGDDGRPWAQHQLLCKANICRASSSSRHSMASQALCPLALVACGCLCQRPPQACPVHRPQVQRHPPQEQGLQPGGVGMSQYCC